MKSKFQLLMLVTLVLLLGSCTPEYKVSITATNNINAPALQSFSHAKSGSEWLLFAGRANSKTTYEGGLHNLNANYADSSFIPRSFNENIYVYNVEADEVPLSISLTEMIKTVSEKYKSTYSKDTLNKYRNVFKNTNALVRQKGDYVYVLGGYGAKDSLPSNGYITYNHVAKIHVPSMIALVKGDYSGVDESKLFAFGQNKNLVSTGGEMYSIGENFYLVGGHNFGKTAANGQKYVDAVYSFSFNPEKQPHVLNIQINSAISDVSDPKGAASDDNSIFRRRDGPVTASLYYNTLNSELEESIAIYAGVFKPGDDDHLEAWNDAIYVHPNWAGENSKLYTYDRAYNQKNYNVYSCPDVVGYDAENKILHTFLLGGIGDGNLNGKEVSLSGFTNTGVHIQLNVDGNPLKSTNTVFSNNLFDDSEKNTHPFYGAEAIFFKNDSASSIGQSKEIIDLKTLFERGDNVDVGYVFGGIESFASHPGTYGKTKSRASNKIWKVTLTKK